MITGFIALFTFAAQIVYNKNVLKNIPYKIFMFIDFFFIFIILSILSPLFITATIQTFNIPIITLLLLASILSLGFNLLYYKGLKQTTVQKAEPLILSNWIFSILLAYIIFPSERQITELILALIAAVTIIITFTHNKKIKLTLPHLEILLSSFLIAVHSIVIKDLLVTFNPFELYYMRLTLQLILFLPFIKISQRFVKRKHFPILGSAIIAILMNVFTYYSYREIGIISTSIILTFTPLLAIFASKIFLKEPIQRKYIISSIIIIACIVFSQAINI